MLRPYARGGLGEVFVAYDEELRREVALKQIQERFADDAPARARFLLEAEVTGGLEHPGIVPVYGLASYPDGRPFYAMRLIRGDTLQEAIGRFHSGTPAGGPTPGLRPLLRRFVDVCNAVAYAHSRGILHRDLKPSNIVLGPFGETLVVDWGLAKALGRPAGEAGSAERPLNPAVPGGSTPTQMGSAIGTPAFMSPEQADGRLDEMGPASDVYSLGATLYCLLTGQAPFPGRDVLAILQRVRRGEFPPPRQVRRTVPPALEAVCLKAMALRPVDRYGSARALADDVERWLADEPPAAYAEPWLSRAGRWARRHKPLTAALVAAVLVAGVLGGLLVWRGQQQAAQQRRGIEAALEEVARLQRQGHWDEARVALDQADRRLAEGGADDLRADLEQARRDLDLVARLDAVRLTGPPSSRATSTRPGSIAATGRSSAARGWERWAATWRRRQPG